MSLAEKSALKTARTSIIIPLENISISKIEREIPATQNKESTSRRSIVYEIKTIDLTNFTKLVNEIS